MTMSDLINGIRKSWSNICGVWSRFNRVSPPEKNQLLNESVWIVKNNY